MQDLHFATNNICIAPCLANLALKNMDGLMKGKHAQKNFSAVGGMAPTPLSLKTGGGGGLGSVTYKDRAWTPPCASVVVVPSC